MNIVLLSGGSSESGSASSLLFLVAIMVVFYFFMIRPQMQKGKKEKKFREELKIGDRVVTIGGMHGKIVGEDTTTFNLQLLEGAVVKVNKSAISLENTTETRS